MYLNILICIKQLFISHKSFFKVVLTEFDLTSFFEVKYLTSRCEKGGSSLFFRGTSKFESNFRTREYGMYCKEPNLGSEITFKESKIDALIGVYPN
jgi:hypothetical protein